MDIDNAVVLEKKKRRRPASVPAKCHHCDTPFMGKNRTARFCSARCRDEHHKGLTRARYGADPVADVQRQFRNRAALANRRWRQISDTFGNQCADCGETCPREVYDLHHVRERKESAEITPSRVIRMGRQEAFRKLLQETILLCANCHRIRRPEAKSELGGANSELQSGDGFSR